MKKQLLFVLISLCSFQLSAQIDVTFRLNMKGQTFQFTTPEVNGTFNNWCGSLCNPMTDADGDSIWEAVISLPNGIIEYKFATDNWANQETLVQGSPCTIFTPPSYLNRKLVVVSPIVLNAVCWGSCDTCSSGPVGPGLQQISLPISWQDSANVNYTTTDFGGTISSLAPDPVDPSKLALKIVKIDSAETWAGTTLGTQAGFPTSIPFSISATEMQVRVYSPAAGTIYRLKAEDKTNQNISVETEAISSVANAWEILTFNFSSPATGTPSLIFSNTYNKLSIFPNFGVNGATAGQQTYYVGDVAFGSIPTSVNAVIGSELSISPNPGSGEFLIYSPGKSAGAATLSVLDLTGREIWNSRLSFSSGQEKISIPGIRAGLYCLRLIRNGKVTQSRFSVVD